MERVTWSHSHATLEGYSLGNAKQASKQTTVQATVCQGDTTEGI